MKKTLLTTLITLYTGSVFANADSIYFGGDILTMNDAQPTAQAVAVKDGNIIAVGDFNSIKQEHKVAATSMVDLDGRTLLPGFIDSHGHLFLSAIKSIFVDMDPAPASNVRNIGDIQRNFSLELAKRAKEGKDDDRMLIGWGYDHAMLEEGRHPTRHDLDKISTDKPIMLIHFSAHQVVANTKLLEIAGISAETENPDGGVIQREEDGKTPNGILEEYASKIVMIPALLSIGYPDAEALPENFVPAAIAQASLNILEEYKSQGFTTATDAGTGVDAHELYKNMASQGALDIDVGIMPMYFQAGPELLAELYSPSYDNHYRVMGGKIGLDGGSPGRTAYLRTPYTEQLQGEEDYRGYPIMTDEKITEFMMDMFEHDVPAFVHALGDAAVDQAINAISAAEEAYPNKPHRTQLIHLQQVQDDQFKAMQDLDVTLTYQMAHSFYFADFHAKHIYGPERTKRLNPVQSGINYGFSTTIHHDAPVHPIDQFTLIWSAVNRTSRSGKVWGEEERISVMDALKASTINAAYQFKEEDIKGSLEVGKMADMIIIDQNPLEIDPQALKDLKVLETIKEGQSVYLAK